MLKVAQRPDQRPCCAVETVGSAMTPRGCSCPSAASCFVGSKQVRGPFAELSTGCGLGIEAKYNFCGVGGEGMGDHWKQKHKSVGEGKCPELSPS